jgi:hypothetical protein
MSRRGLFILIALAVHVSFGQDVRDNVNQTVRSAAEQIENAQIPREDAVKITATFIETQTARDALKKSLSDYVQSMNTPEYTNATRLTRYLTKSEGQLRIMQSASRLSKELDQIGTLATEFHLIAPDAARLATTYGASKKAPVVDEANRPTLVPPTKEQAAELLRKMQANDSAFEAAYVAFCAKMENRFGFTFIAEATQVALSHA